LYFTTGHKENKNQLIQVTSASEQVCALSAIKTSRLMDKLRLARQNLDQFFNSGCGCVRAMQLPCFETKLASLKLKTLPKQLLGSLPLEIALPNKL